ncbi:hypothetical protein [Pseudonocardia spinosispora]|uniref:hypothetical protein n=1 Tax=Pseudonocardia spinosispora TaxID=103441 RepID=UPI0012EBBCE5|nr:hypothetical protein [Pseudonocardia spinosispora]
MAAKLAVLVVSLATAVQGPVSIGHATDPGSVRVQLVASLAPAAPGDGPGANGGQADPVPKPKGGSASDAKSSSGPEVKKDEPKTTPATDKDPGSGNVGTQPEGANPPKTEPTQNTGGTRPTQAPAAVPSTAPQSGAPPPNSAPTSNVAHAPQPPPQSAPSAASVAPPPQEPNATPTGTVPGQPSTDPLVAKAGQRLPDGQQVLGVSPKPLDPETAKVLSGLPKDRPTDLSSTKVDGPARNALVLAEDGNVGKVNSMIDKLGGPNAEVRQTPLVLQDKDGNTGSATLFTLKGADGKDYIVDGQGAKYSGMQDYLENNQLSEDWTMVRPANPGADGPQDLVTGAAHVVSDGEKTARAIDGVAGPLAAAGDGLVLGAGAVTALSGGTAAPGTVPAAAVGETMSIIGGGWSSARVLNQMVNDVEHGRDVDPEQLMDLVSSAAVPGAGKRLLRHTESSAPDLPKGPLAHDPKSAAPSSQQTPVTAAPNPSASRLNTGAGGVPPAGVKPGWQSRPADNGKGTVYQDPARAGVDNGNQVRVMDPGADRRYPDGYVRFYNKNNQPVGLDGKPGNNAHTHIPQRSDGSYDLPQGW